MEVYKRPDTPFWGVDFTHPGTGQRVRRSTGKKTKAQAQARGRELLAEAEAEAVEAKDGRIAITIRQAVAEYVESLEGRTGKPQRNIRVLQDKLTGERAPFNERWHLDADRPLHSLDPIDLERLIRARRAEGNSLQTAVHEIKLLRSVVRYAGTLRRRMPEALMASGWKLPKLTLKTRYLSQEEFQKVFAFMDPLRPVQSKSQKGNPRLPYVASGQQLAERQAAQDMLVALVMTGGRYNEINLMTWEQVNLTEGTIMIWAGKTQTSRRVPIPAVALAILKRRKESSTSPFIFPGTDGTGARCRASSKPILRALNECGLNRADIVARHGRATVHSLRHTFASWLAAGGADLQEVQQALGHASLQMTTRYRHLSPAATATKLRGILDAAL